jgi:3-mercaptopyruvate sulfurtransferase SseA
MRLNYWQRRQFLIAVSLLVTVAVLTLVPLERDWMSVAPTVRAVTVTAAVARDRSPPLASLDDPARIDRNEPETPQADVNFVSTEAVSTRLVPAAREQTKQGTKAPPEILTCFDGLGDGFEGPQGKATLRNPSDNSLAVGPDHIVQTVNSKMAIFTKKGARFDTTGKVLYGPVNTGNVFKGFGDFGDLNGGDAVVRYDQLADRWLVVLPIFRRLPFKKNDPPGKSGGPVQLSLRGVAGQPGAALPLYQPKPSEQAGGPKGGPRPKVENGSYAMCYAVSTSSDPLGSYYRYIFERPLFPDYPRPAVWPDGYYVTTSTSDYIIQRHAYVVERAKMLKGEDATEQGFILDDVVFLLNADLDGKQLPPPGAPNIVMTNGGAQLKKIVQDDGIYWWKYHVDWADPAKSKLDGPVKIPVEPYHYLGDGQLTKCVPQPATEQRLDVQGDKLMARLVYRRIGDRESIVGAQSVKTSSGGGGIRWYEFRLDKERNVQLHQQGTYAPDEFYRWMPSPAIDGQGNIGIGYSFGGTPHFPGQRFAGRLSDDPLGELTLREAILAEGEASQTYTNRWQDYSQTALDPTDDRTIWYVGDYIKKGATLYSTRIGAFRLGEKKDDKPKVTEIPEAVIKKFDLDTEFYKKHVDYKGFSILSSAKVSDQGLLEARHLIDKLLGDREDILKAMIERGCRFMVMAPTEMTTDVPEQRHMKNDPKTNWDRRARGLGGKLSSCGEENLLNLKGDRYRQENILIHEFNHAIHQQGLRLVDPTFDGRLRKAYQAAMEKGLWKGMYSATNHSEYWAEGAQAYFDCMRPQFGANTREKLQQYDPELFKLVDEVYKESTFRYVRYDQRNPPPAKEVPSMLIGPEQLQKTLQEGGLRILDTRSQGEYAKSHIPGAVRIDGKRWQQLGQKEGGFHDAQAWGKEVGQLGITFDSAVVVYGSSLSDTARIWWTLKYLGLGNVSILDAGWELWTKENRPVDAALPSVKIANFEPKFQADRLEEIDTLKKAIRSGQVTIVDARTKAEFTGQDVRGKRGGHIPGAKHLEWKELLDEQGRFLAPERLRTLFRQRGIETEQTAVTC